jgi:hypothetical protein
MYHQIFIIDLHAPVDIIPIRLIEHVPDAFYQRVKSMGIKQIIAVTYQVGISPDIGADRRRLAGNGFHQCHCKTFPI